jgi:DNA mismatch repair protein MutH
MQEMPASNQSAVELRPVKSHEAAAGDNDKPGNKLSVLNIEIHGRPLVQFFVCVAGVFACGVTHDFVQEYVFRHDAFDFGWFMTLWSSRPPQSHQAMQSVLFQALHTCAQS